MRRLNQIISNLPNKQQVGYTGYSNVIKSKSQPAVTIKPKNSKQPLKQTKTWMVQNLNPTEVNIQFSMIRAVTHGELWKCHTEKENEKFLSLVPNNLPDSYKLKEFNGLKPRIRIIEMGETNSWINGLILERNSHQFPSDADFKIVEIFSHQKNKNCFQAINQLNYISSNGALHCRNVFKTI